MKYIVIHLIFLTIMLVFISKLPMPEHRTMADIQFVEED